MPVSTRSAPFPQAPDPAEVEVEVVQVSVDVQIAGPPGPPGGPGPPGEEGPQGPPGAGGGALSRYVHIQSVMSPTWIVQHNLQTHPVVSCEDAAGNVINGSVTYLDDSTLTVGFAFSITGRANCI